VKFPGNFSVFRKALISVEIFSMPARRGSVEIFGVSARESFDPNFFDVRKERFFDGFVVVVG
jgi:hypothetical protein